MSDINTKGSEGEKAAVKRKPHGCGLYFLLFFCIWAAGAWLLWHISKDTQPRTENSGGSGLFFEIIPGSDERSSVEDDMEDRGRSGRDASGVRAE